MSKSPATVRTAVLIVTIIVSLAVGWFMVISPKRQEASALSLEITETHAQIDAAQGATGTGQPQANPIRVADLFKLSRAMPDKADIPNVLLQLSQISAETGVSFQSITPHDPV